MAPKAANMAKAAAGSSAWKSAINTILLLLLLIGCVWYFAAPTLDLFRNKIAAYSMECEELADKKGHCPPGKLHAGPVTKYLVNVDQQFVVGMTDGELSPRKLYRCVVADRRDWTCAVDEDPAARHLVMHDGDLMFDADDPSGVYEKFVSRWEWVTRKLGE